MKLRCLREPLHARRASGKNTGGAGDLLLRLDAGQCRRSRMEFLEKQRDGGSEGARLVVDNF